MFLLAEPLAHLLLSGHLGQRGPARPWWRMHCARWRSHCPLRPCPTRCSERPAATGTCGPRSSVDKIGRSVRPAARGADRGVGGERGAARAALGACPTSRAPSRAGTGCAGSGAAQGTNRPPSRRIRPRLSRAATRLPADSGAAVGRRRAMAQRDLGGFWRFTAPRALATLAQITLQRIDIVLVAIMRGPAEAADLHRRDPVPGRRAVRQRRDQHGRAAAVRRAVRGRRPARRQPGLPGRPPPG